MIPVSPLGLDKQTAGRLPAEYGTGREQASWPESVRRTWDPFEDDGELPASPADPIFSAIEATSRALRRNYVKTGLNFSRCICVEPPTLRGQQVATASRDC